MRLVNWQIEEICKDGAIAPFDPDLLNPASLDIRVGLHHKILTPKGFVPLDFSGKDAEGKYQISRDKPYCAMPGDRLLIGTLEKFKLPNDIEGQFYLTSSRGREFLQSMMAGYIDPGFFGILTLELINLSFDTIPLYPGKIIGQIKFDRLENEPTISYRDTGRYNGCDGAATSKGDK